jgi:nicotinamide mononucleotide (NMN) deamidase PncC
MSSGSGSESPSIREAKEARLQARRDQIEQARQRREEEVRVMAAGAKARIRRKFGGGK